MVCGSLIEELRLLCSPAEETGAVSHVVAPPPPPPPPTRQAQLLPSLCLLLSNYVVFPPTGHSRRGQCSAE